MKLRIISGSLKGRYIIVPQLKATRPTTDRVKETVFNILWNRIDLEGMKVLDLYSGSGSLGFEAASRGAARVDFVEDHPGVVKVLESNLKSLSLEGVCGVARRTAVSFTSAQISNPYDLIMADPPFFKDDIYDVVENIYANKLLAPEGILFIERSIQTRENDEKNFGIKAYRQAGDACLYFFTSERKSIDD